MIYKIRYDTNKADWQKFKLELLKQFNTISKDVRENELEERTEILMRILTAASDKGYTT
jgi:hypothetical protein